MYYPSTLLALAACTSGSLAAYTLVQDYTSENFFSEFTFFTVRSSPGGMFTGSCKLTDNFPL